MSEDDGKPRGRILIAGCGYVGGRLARLLIDGGATVHALRRSSGPSLPGAARVHADLCDRRSLTGLPQPLDAVVFAASPTTHDEAGYRAVFVDGLRNLIDAVAGQERPPSRLVFTSSTAVYGQTDGEWVDEDSPARPRRFNGRVLLDAEASVRESPVPGCVLRLGGIYGPGRTRLIEQVRARTARLGPGVPHYTNRIHREDAARSLMHLLSLGHVEPVYLGVDHEPAAENDVLRFAARELGLPEPPAGDAQATRRTGSKRCRNERLLASGYRFTYPTYREGYRALLSRS